MREAAVAIALIVGLTGAIAAAGPAPGTGDEPVVARHSVREGMTGGPTADASGTDRTAGPPTFDRTRFRITVFANGSARWTFQYRRYLPDNETAKERFRDYATRFENETTDLYEGFRRRAGAIVAAAENETGRPMAATNFSRSARLQTGVNVVGIVEMSFVWTNFSRVRNDCPTATRCVIVGDVFEGGLFIGRDQSLVVRPGPQLEFSRVAPDGTLSGATLPGSDSITWKGPRQFTDEHPRIVLRPEEVDGSTTTWTKTVTRTPTKTPTPVPTPTPTTSRTATTGADGATGSGPAGPSNRSDGQSWPMVVGLLAVVAVAGGTFVYRQRTVEPDDDGDPGATTSTTDDSGDGPAVPEEELMTDEDRVVTLLEDNGGRMRQVNIVEETGWSKSKVSMLLSDMEEEDAITKLRVGRENIISLEGEEPDAATSPFEDEE